MSRRTQLYKRSLIQRGTELRDVTQVTSTILNQHKPAGKRFEKTETLDKNGNPLTHTRAVGHSSCAITPTKAARIAAMVCRS